MNATTATGPAAAWRARLETGALSIQHCPQCAAAIFEPRMFCPTCGHEELDWIACSGLGTLYSFTVISRKPEHGGPYGVALVDLAEGARIMARPKEVEGLVIGMPVEVTVEAHPTTGHWLRCAPAGGSQ